MQQLTLRELDVTKLLSEGKTNKEISRELNLSVHTIKANLENIYFKLGIKNRVQLAIYYVKNILDKA